MLIATTKRAGNAFCRICNHKFKKDEKYMKLDGTHRIMRSRMCMIHFAYEDCDGCADKLQCLTHDKLTKCIKTHNNQGLGLRVRVMEI
jgi:hypothetical protein